MIRSPIAVMLFAAAALACQGPKGDIGPAGPAGAQGTQGPAGTFSGSFTGDVTFTGNATITGNLAAANLLATEAFTGWLTNAADFTAPTGTAPVQLKYTDVKQNSNAGVFRMELDGTLTVLRPGVVNLSATFDVIGTTNYARALLRLNGTDLADSLAPNNGTNWSQVTVSTFSKVAANDALSVFAFPDQITNMDNGIWSRLTVQWTGVP